MTLQLIPHPKLSLNELSDFLYYLLSIRELRNHLASRVILMLNHDGLSFLKDNFTTP